MVRRHISAAPIIKVCAMEYILQDVPPRCAGTIGVIAGDLLGHEPSKPLRWPHLLCALLARLRPWPRITGYAASNTSRVYGVQDVLHVALRRPRSPDWRDGPHLLAPNHA